MELVKLDKELPEIIYEVYKKTKELLSGENFAIAGGCLSDIYMGKEFKDIDVFIPHNFNKTKFEESFGTDYQTLDSDNEYDDIKIPYLYKVNYKGHKIEFIVSPQHEVTEFDVRFRQFYYVKDEFLASKAAMEDIENKRIVVCNPRTPVSTFFRMHRFKEIYNFEIDPLSEQYVKWSFNVKNSINKSKERFFNYVNDRKHKISEELYNWFMDVLNEQTDENIYFEEGADFPYHKEAKKWVEFSLNDRTVPLAIYHEDLEKFEPFNHELDEIEINLEDFKDHFLQMKKDFDSYRIKYLLSEYQKQVPFPIVEKEKVLTEYTKYLDQKFITKMGEFSYKQMRQEKDYKVGEILEKYNILKITTRKVKPKLKVTLERPFQFHSYGSFITNNKLYLEINIGDDSKERLLYGLRKCTNGKYTISEYYNGNKEMETSKLLLEYVFNQIKEKSGDIIAFNEKELTGIGTFNYTESSVDTYFRPKKYVEKNYFNCKNKFYELEFTLNNS